MASPLKPPILTRCPTSQFVEMGFSEPHSVKSTEGGQVETTKLSAIALRSAAQTRRVPGCRARRRQGWPIGQRCDITKQKKTSKKTSKSPRKEAITMRLIGDNFHYPALTLQPSAPLFAHGPCETGPQPCHGIWGPALKRSDLIWDWTNWTKTQCPHEYPSRTDNVVEWRSPSTSMDAQDPLLGHWQDACCWSFWCCLWGLARQDCEFVAVGLSGFLLFFCGHPFSCRRSDMGGQATASCKREKGRRSVDEPAMSATPVLFDSHFLSSG